MKRNFWTFLFLILGFLIIGRARPGLAQYEKQLKPYAKLMKPDVKTGEVAPDFTLKSEDKQTTITLSKRYAEKPVALIFGSYT